MLRYYLQGIVTFEVNGIVYVVNGLADALGYAPIQPIWKYDWTLHQELAEIYDTTVDDIINEIGTMRVSLDPFIDGGLAFCE